MVIEGVMENSSDAFTKTEDDEDYHYNLYRRIMRYAVMPTGFDVINAEKFMLRPLMIPFVMFIIATPFLLWNSLTTNSFTYSEMTEALSTTGKSSQIVGNIILAIIYRHSMRKMWNGIQLQRRIFLKKFETIVVKFGKLQTTVCVTLLTSYILTYLSYVGMALYFRDEGRQILQFYQFPFLSMDVKSQWWINFFMQALGVLDYILYCGVIDSHFLTALQHIQLRYKILSKMVMNIQNIMDSNDVDMEKNVKRELRQLCVEHTETKEFIDTVNQCFGFGILFLFLCNTLVLCMLINAIAENLINNLYPYLIANLFQMFLCCYFGEVFLIESEKFILGLYDTTWYKMSLTNKKTFLIILHNAQQPVYVEGFFFKANLNGFLWYCKTAYSCFTLLQNVRSPE